MMIIVWVHKWVDRRSGIVAPHICVIIIIVIATTNTIIIINHDHLVGAQVVHNLCSTSGLTGGGGSVRRGSKCRVQSAATAGLAPT